MRKKILLGFGGFAGILLIFGLKTWYDAGEFKTITSYSRLDDCTGYHTAASSEDIVVDHETGMAFISSDDIRLSQTRIDAPQGMIYGLDLGNPGSELVELTPDPGFDFHPLGMGLYVANDSTRLLFVVNRSLKNGHSVEIFRYLPGPRLVHVETIRDPLIYSANDVAPVGERRFYLTNDHRYTRGLLKMAEEYLQLSIANLVYYDGRQARVVAQGIGYANSVLVDEQKNRVFVSATIDQGIHVFARDPETNALQPQSFIRLGTGVDNLSFGDSDVIWAAAHPKLLTFVAYLEKRVSLSPSQVLRIRLDGEKYDVDEPFLNRGEVISASSVAVPYQNRLLIGSVLDRRLKNCRLTAE